MTRNHRTTPPGTKDLLLEESLARREAQEALSALFRSRGFSEVMTPGLEYLDVFTGSQPVESMYKLTDSQGRLLVMRPDSTLPIARMAASRLAFAPRPLRFFYAQDIYHRHPGLTGRSDQEFQAGVELIGASGLRADLEMISLAAQALSETVGEAFRIEIGHVEFFRSLIASLHTDEETEADILDHIEEKNYASLGDLLDRLPQSETVDAIRRLPRLFGGEEVLASARELAGEREERQALAYLASLYDLLGELGLSRHIMLDLGMWQRNEYYTGVIFRGYIEGSGEVALSGGRYDTLLRRFGADCPATGFAINMNAVTSWLQRRGKISPPPPPQVLVYAHDGCEARALERTHSLVAEGIRAEYAVQRDWDEAKRYAEAKGIGRIVTVSPAGEREEKLAGKETDGA